MPTSENSAIGTGRPIAWPSIWSFWLRAKRVKSGMLRASVAQRPIMAVSDGANTSQNWPSFLPPAAKCDGALMKSPKPPALS